MKKNEQATTSFFNRLLYFFPLQLLFVHIKKNQQLLLFWLLIFLAIFEQIGVKYGLPYLLLAPEYLGALSFSSYLIVGFALGGFVMAFNISSYIMNGFRFPFLATLSKPFLKYSINNSLIPLLLLICYITKSSEFLLTNENFELQEVLLRQSGFIAGYLSFTIISMAYFLATNKDFEKLFGKELGKVLSSDNENDEPAKILLNKKGNQWYEKSQFQKAWRVDSYIGAGFRLKLTRSYQHYDQNMLSQVFRQNHINASLFEVVVLISILVLGVFRENPIFTIPAGATILLVFTMLLMITSAIRSWIRGWTLIVIIGLMIAFNQLSKYDNFYYDSRAYGLKYNSLANYPSEGSTAIQRSKDFQQTLRMLENWKKKNLQASGKKPKAVFLAVSGGGARAASWSFLALQHLDSLSNGELMKHTIMGTGSSGGMIGTAYFRELKIKAKEGLLDPYSSRFKTDLSKDILNPIMFNFAVNDVLIRTGKFEFEGQKYSKDRGYIFEKTLDENTHNLFQEQLGDYQEEELNATVPTLIFTPSIINDSRRLLISALPLSFLEGKQGISTSENIDFHSLFANNEPLKTKYTSVLRMNASFPYIMPSVSMPSQPKIEVFDSGLRDNYGIKTSLQYIFHIRKWLETNTSGIIILQIRDGLKNAPAQANNGKESIVKELLSPFGSLYGNWFEVQDYNNDELLQYTKEWYSGEVDLINYQLNKSPDNYISLSWHLTSKEKKQIIKSLDLSSNRQSEARLKKLLN